MRLGISPTLTVFRGTPTLRIDRQQPPPRNRRDGWPDQDAGQRARRSATRCRARAWRRVEWRNGTNPPWAADFAARAGHTGHRLAAAPARPRGVAALRARARADRPPQTLLRLAAGLGVARAAGAAGASPVGHRTALPGSQDGTRPRPLRRAELSGVAAPHGDQRGRLCVSCRPNGCGPARDRGSRFRRRGPSSRKSSPGCCLSVAPDTCSG